MEYRNILKNLCVFATCISGVLSRDDAVTLTLQPAGDGRVRTNSTVSLLCTVDMRVVSRSSVDWFHCDGNNRYQIGTDSYISTLKFSSSRYYLSSEQVSSTDVMVYKLTILRACTEDSGTIECSVKSSSRKAAISLAVCDDTESAICQCAHSSGWLSLDCIYMRGADEGFKRASVGLSVCLAVTILFAAVTTAYVIIDCRHRAASRRQADEQRQTTLAESAAAISARTAGSSALKTPLPVMDSSPSGVGVRGRTAAVAGVRFMDPHRPTGPGARDISC